MNQQGLFFANGLLAFTKWDLSEVRPNETPRRFRRGVRQGQDLEGAGYGSFELTVVKVPASLVPMAVRAVTSTTATRAAIRPYSMAVAPDSSFMKRVTNF